MSGSVRWGGVLSNQLTMMLQNVEPTANGRGHGGYIHPYTLRLHHHGYQQILEPSNRNLQLFGNKACHVVQLIPKVWAVVAVRLRLQQSGKTILRKSFFFCSFFFFKPQSQTMKFKKIWKKMLISSDTTSHIIYGTVISDFFAMLGKNPTSKGEPARTWQQSLLGGTHYCNHITSFSNAEM